MSTDINTVTILGRLGKDAELKYLNTGTALLLGSIANNQGYTKDGEWTETVHWFDFKMWGKRAEGIAQYLTKGTKIAIQGTLNQERWETDGNRRSKVVIMARDINFAGGKKKDNGDYQKPPPKQEAPAAGDDDFQDDIPF